MAKAQIIDLLIEQSCLLQAEGLKSVFEEARRQQPVCSMALNWCFNEPWPTVAGNHIVNWKHKRKPAYEAVKSALRQTLTSARNTRLAWTEGEIFEAELWVLNDGFDKEKIGEITAALQIDGIKVGSLKWYVPEADGQTNIKGPTFRVRLPGAKTGVMALKLCVEGRPGLDSEYRFICRPAKT